MLTNDNALVWSLTIHNWDGKRYDPSLSKEINASYNAAKDAGTYTRKIVPGALLTAVTNAKTEMRDRFNDVTHPHHAKGSRVSSRARFLEVKAVIAEHEMLYNHEADRFVKQYTDWLTNNGPQAFLKDMYKPNLYPEPSQVRKRFSVDMTVQPYTIAPTGDSALDLSLQEEFDKAQLKEDSMLRADISNRIYKIVSNIYQRLMSDGKFRKEPFEALVEKAELIKTLNIFNDPRIDSISRDAAALANLDLTDLRKDDSHRAFAANKASDILDKLNNLRSTPSVTSTPTSNPRTENSAIQNSISTQPSVVRNDPVHAEIPAINGYDNTGDQRDAPLLEL